MDRPVRSCNTINDLSIKVCLPNKTKYLNLNVFNMITEIIESKIFTTHMPCEFKCELDGKAVIQNNGGRMININVNIKKSYM